MFEFVRNQKNIYCNCLYYSTNALARKITKMADEEFSVTGLSSSYAFVMMTVNSHPEIQPNQIAEIMMLMPSTVTRLVEKLEAKGLLERKAQGKYSYITSTIKGKELDEKIKTAWNNLYKRYSTLLGKKLTDELTIDIFKAAEIISE